MTEKRKERQEIYHRRMTPPAPHEGVFGWLWEIFVYFLSAFVSQLPPQQPPYADPSFPHLLALEIQKDWIHSCQKQVQKTQKKIDQLTQRWQTTKSLLHNHPNLNFCLKEKLTIELTVLEKEMAKKRRELAQKVEARNQSGYTSSDYDSENSDSDEEKQRTRRKGYGSKHKRVTTLLSNTTSRKRRNVSR